MESMRCISTTSRRARVRRHSVRRPPPPPPQVYHVTDADPSGTLPALLRHWRPDLSWGAAKQLLKSRQVSVNGATCLDEGRRLKAGDVVHIHPHPRTPQPTGDDVELLHWDEDILVVVKP